MLSLVSQGLESLENFCWNCGTESCNARTKDSSCANPSFEPISATMSLLDAYGLSGTVQYSYIDPATGKGVAVSLLSQNASFVPFCSAFQSEYYHSRDIYFESYPALLTQIKSAEVDCASRRWLPGTVPHVLRPIQQSEASKERATRLASRRLLGEEKVRNGRRRAQHESHLIFFSRWQRHLFPLLAGKTAGKSTGGG